MPHHELEAHARGVLPDPAALVARQLARDELVTAWRPSLLDRKKMRMRVSPFAFLRGTAPLYYELLAACPSIAQGPDGEGWLIGDMHIENFGALRCASQGDDRPDVVFDLNDFDDAVQGPWYLDVLRLTTSLLLAARAIGADGSEAITLGRALLDAYRATLSTGHALKAPEIVARFVEKVKDRTRTALLDSRTKVVGKKRKFVHGDRYDALPDSLRDHVPQALAGFTPMDGSPRPPDDHLEVLDAALRIAGTGSLGCRRAAVLTVGKGGVDGAWIFDLKEQRAPSASVLLDSGDLKPNVRVVTAARACMARPHLMQGTATLAGISVSVRRLMPQEDKLDAASLDPEAFRTLAPYFGSLAAAAHTRGARQAPRHPWTKDDGEAVLANAATLAGWHEAAYLAFSLSLVPR